MHHIRIFENVLENMLWWNRYFQGRSKSGRHPAAAQPLPLLLPVPPSRPSCSSRFSRSSCSSSPCHPPAPPIPPVPPVPPVPLAPPAPALPSSRGGTTASPDITPDSFLRVGRKEKKEKKNKNQLKRRSTSRVWLSVPRWATKNGLQGKYIRDTRRNSRYNSSTSLSAETLLDTPKRKK